MKKRLQKVLLCAAVAAGIALSPAGAGKAMAAQEVSVTHSGSNVGAQNYSRWSSTVKSYLTYNENGFMRVQAGSSIEGLLVEYYSTDYQLLSSHIIPAELPIFGGFYESGTNYFVVTGQENPEESSSVEVFRITKYDKNWNRIASVGLSNCNTTVPFDAGSLRMAEYDKYLLIRTCHEMYRSSDGYNHQANVTIQVDMESMQITDSFTRIMNEDYGYVSHSFNQFIAVDDGKIVALDHGDAYPRSLVLIKYSADITSGRFTPDYYNSCKAINVMSFPGATGQNSTGATAGGFEVGEDYYLVAGNSVVQDSSNLSRRTRNVFVASVSKTTGEVATNWLTAYDEGEGTTSTPQMVKVAEGEYVILWERDDAVYYTKVDEKGEQIGQTYQMEGDLSDCVPVVAGDRLVWYTWSSNTLTFHDISLTNFGGGAADSADGLKPASDGSWYYYQNGQIAADYTGLAYDEAVGWWYVENGKINFDYNGLIPFGDAWWCVAGGRVVFDYTGLWCDPTVGWWYVENGTINFGYNGLIPFGDAWWCVAGGGVVFDYTGLWSDPNVGWWYVENGTINFDYNGLIPFGDAWWCVAGGGVVFDYTGLWCDPDVGWWYVENGMINFDFTGLVELDGIWWYVQEGRVGFEYSGPVVWNEAAYEVVNGQVV